MDDIDPRVLRDRMLSNCLPETVILPEPTRAPHSTYPAYRAKAMTCHDCHLSTQPLRGIPTRYPFDDTTGRRFAVLSAAPIVGRQRNVYEALLKQAEIDPSLAAWGSAVVCRPVDPTGRTADPDTGSLVACRGKMLAGLGNLQAVLLVGAAAVRVWRPDLTHERTTGNVFLWTIPTEPPRIVLPTISPGRLLREKYCQREMRDEMLADLRKFARVLAWVEQGRDIRAMFGLKCVECGAKEVDYTDPDGCGWCAVHVDRKNGKGGIDRWAKARSVWDEMAREEKGKEGVVGLPFTDEGAISVKGRDAMKPAKKTRSKK